MGFFMYLCRLNCWRGIKGCARSAHTNEMTNEINNIENQEGAMQQEMPPQVVPFVPQQQMSMRKRRINNAAQARAVFPKWLSRNALIVYFLSLAVVTFMYSAYSLPLYYMLSGAVAVGVFFLYGSTVIKDTLPDAMRRESKFEKRIFLTAFIPRVIWMFLIYTIFMQNYGDAFGFENADATYYNDLGQFAAGLIKKGNFHFYDEISHWSGHDDISDMGYGVYVGLIYALTDNGIIAVRLLKCVWSSLTVILIYRLAKRNFDVQTARMAAIFCALWPNFWYYCGAHLKEVEMVFLAVLFVEQADQMLRSRQFTAWKVIPVLLIAAAIFTMRTPLGMVAILALIFSVVMASTRVVSWGKRIIVGGLAIALIGVVAGNQLEEKARGLLDSRTDQQETGLNWYATRENGNVLVKYAGTSIFAPLIFTLPFPTFATPNNEQYVQQLNNGGNFVKNIVSGFTIFALVMLLLSGHWREHMLPLSFMLGYLVVLAMSSFAHSERFHQPAMPFEFMFAAYGISIAVTQKKYKRWFTYWCGLMFVAAILWNWFKMAGRGLG